MTLLLRGGGVESNIMLKNISNVCVISLHVIGLFASKYLIKIFMLVRHKQGRNTENKHLMIKMTPFPCILPRNILFTSVSPSPA